MKEKKRILVCAAIFFIFAFAVYFWVFNGKNELHNVIKENDKEIWTDSFHEKTRTESNVLPKVSKGGMDINKNKQRESYFKEQINKNRKIDFKGKVVDQFNRPVDNALLKIEIFSFNKDFLRINKDFEKIKNIEVKSGKDGLFHVGGFGVSLKINEICKVGYRYNSYPRFKNNSLNGISVNTIKILKLDETEPLFKGTIKRYDIKANGTKYYVDLRSRKIYDSEDDNCDLIISITQEIGDVNNESGISHWSYTLQAVDGGIITAKSHEHLAPPSGYMSVINFTTEGMEKKCYSVKKKYFLFNRAKSTYSLINLYVSEFKRNEFLVEFEYYINPMVNSRNLSYDTFKRLRKFPDIKR